MRSKIQIPNASASAFIPVQTFIPYQQHQVQDLTSEPRPGRSVQSPTLNYGISACSPIPSTSELSTHRPAHQITAIPVHHGGGNIDLTTAPPVLNDGRNENESPPPAVDRDTPPTLPHSIWDPARRRNYKIGGYLGKGGFAWCYEAVDMEDGTVYAVKVIPKFRLTKPHHKDKVIREIRIHGRMNHRHIVKLRSSFEDEQNIYIIMEYCQLKSLVVVMKRRGTLTEPEVKYYIRQLLLSIHYLVYTESILHRDIKLGNLLLSSDMEIKLADFGLASEMESHGSTSTVSVCGTPNYISPEVLMKKGHSVASEMWAVGCTVFAMLVGKPPFETDTLEDTYRAIQSCRYTIPVCVSREAQDLIIRCLDTRPGQRPLPLDALEHPFFTRESVPYRLSEELCYRAPVTQDHSSSQISAQRRRSSAENEPPKRHQSSKNRTVISPVHYSPQEYNSYYFSPTAVQDIPKSSYQPNFHWSEQQVKGQGVYSVQAQGAAYPLSYVYQYEDGTNGQEQGYQPWSQGGQPGSFGYQGWNRDRYSPAAPTPSAVSKAYDHVRVVPKEEFKATQVAPLADAEPISILSSSGSPAILTKNYTNNFPLVTNADENRRRNDDGRRVSRILVGGESSNSRSHSPPNHAGYGLNQYSSSPDRKSIHSPSSSGRSSDSGLGRTKNERKAPKTTAEGSWPNVHDFRAKEDWATNQKAKADEGWKDWKCSDSLPGKQQGLTNEERFVFGLETEFYQVVTALVGNHGQTRIGGKTCEPVQGGIPVLFVAKWIDYTNRFGFGCQLSDGTVCVSFLDGSKVCTNTDGSINQYVAPSQRSCLQRTDSGYGEGAAENGLNGENPLIWFSDDGIPSGMESKSEVMQFFYNYMNENLLRGCDAIGAATGEVLMPYVVHWKRLESKALLMILSDGTLQVNFFGNHVKMILKQYGKGGGDRDQTILTYVDEERHSRSFLITDSASSGGISSPCSARNSALHKAADQASMGYAAGGNLRKTLSEVREILTEELAAFTNRGSAPRSTVMGDLRAGKGNASGERHQFKRLSQWEMLATKC